MSTPIDPVEAKTKKKWRPVIAGKEIKKRWIVLLALVLLFILAPSSDDDTTEAGPAPVAAVETEKPTESAKPTVDAEAETEEAAAEKAVAERVAAEQRAAEEAERKEQELKEAEEKAAAEKRAKEEAEAKEAAEREAAEEEDFGEVVTQALLDANLVDSFRSLNPESPGFWIADIESLNSSTVRVNVQTHLTDDERETFARWVFNMACSNVPDLDTVVINDTTGLDSNHFIHRMVTVCS